MWYAVDPGETSGFAKFDGSNEVPVEIGEVKYKDFFGWLQDIKLFTPDGNDEAKLVSEDYKIRPEVMPRNGRVAYTNNHDWNDGKTLRLIGAMGFYCHIYRIPFILQQPSIKPMAYQMIGQKYVRGKSGMHMSDAVAHGVYWLRREHNKRLGV